MSDKADLNAERVSLLYLSRRAQIRRKEKELKELRMKVKKQLKRNPWLGNLIGQAIKGKKAVFSSDDSSSSSEEEEKKEPVSQPPQQVPTEPPKKRASGNARKRIRKLF